jgi:hypothetical protein
LSPELAFPLVVGEVHFIDVPHTPPTGASPELLANIRTMPPEERIWADLQRLEACDPEFLLQTWGEVKKAAAEEVRQAPFLFLSLEGVRGQPWDRARAIAVYRELLESFQPQTGAERQLVEIRAGARWVIRFWTKLLRLWSAHVGDRE